MDSTALLIARIQFGLTLTYHFWFVALTLGLSVLIAFMETQYVRTGKLAYKIHARYWGRFFLINYAVAIVTGLVNEFQFGMNWAEYSRFVGSVFGPPLAFEALTAFFVESIAIGIWAYGWDKVSKKAHLAAIWLVAWSANYSAFWILSANSFMQHPVGFILQNGRLELASLKDLITNQYLFYQYSHTVLAGFATAGFFLLAVSSYNLLRGQHAGLFKWSFKIGLFSALLATVLLVVTGHFYNQYLFKVQPMKAAAAEALWETAGPAGLALAASIDEERQENSYQLLLPGALSVLAYNDPDAAVKGMRELQQEYSAVLGPGNYIPPVKLLFWSFRIKVAIGLWLVMLLAVVCWRWKQHLIESSPGLLKALILSLPLPYIAIAAGWLFAEVGRQPWAIYGILLTKNSVSKTVSTDQLWLSISIYSVVYAAVALAALYLAQKTLLNGPEQETR